MHKIKHPEEVTWVWILDKFFGHFYAFCISQMVTGERNVFFTIFFQKNNLQISSISYIVLKNM
jgi:hypothetical protein